MSKCASDNKSDHLEALDITIQGCTSFVHITNYPYCLRVELSEPLSATKLITIHDPTEQKPIL